MLHCVIVVVYNTYMVAFAPIHEKEIQMKKTVLQKCMAIWELKTSIENCASDDKTEITSWTDDELMDEARYVLSLFREGGHAFHDDMYDDSHEKSYRANMRRQYKALVKLVEG